MPTPDHSPPPLWKRLLSVWGRAPVPVGWRMGAQPSPAPRKAPYPWLQALYDRLPGSEFFEGELIGRRLLTVWALRDPQKAYPEDSEAASFWLQLSGDDKDHHVWVRPGWIVNFFDKTWMLLPRAVVASATSELGFVRSADEGWYRRPEWSSLVGLTLSEVHVANGYEPHLGALSLHFKNEGSPGRGPKTASLLFDWGSDKDENMENTALCIENRARLGPWPLNREVQSFLESPRGDWSIPRSVPAPPWNDEAHWQALTRFRRELQGWLVSWSGLVAGSLDLPARGAANLALYDLLDKLCAFEIGLAHRSVWQASGGGWLDSDGDEYGEHWLRYSDGHTDQSLAEETWAALKQAWPLVAQDRYAEAWRRLGLDVNAPRVQRQVEYLAPVWAAFQQWWPVFQRLLAVGKA